MWTYGLDDRHSVKQFDVYSEVTKSWVYKLLKVLKWISPQDEYGPPRKKTL